MNKKGNPPIQYTLFYKQLFFRIGPKSCLFFEAKTALKMLKFCIFSPQHSLNLAFFTYIPKPFKKVA